MKLVQIIFCFLLFIIFVNAQEKVAHMPKPVGGMESIINNVLYPKDAKKEGIEGKALVVAVVDENGDVQKVSIANEVNDLLGKAAMEAIKKTKFTPGKDENGNVVKTEITIPIKFKLDNCKKKKKEEKHS